MLDSYSLEQTFCNDEAVNFNGLLIYPVTMKDYFSYSIYSSVLTIKKNKIPDPKIISMSYMKFLYYTIFETGGENATAFSDLIYGVFSLCLRDNKPDIFFKTVDGELFLSVNEVLLSSDDFDELAKIILLQNNPDYDDSYIDPELEEDLAKVEELKNKGSKMVSIEKQMISVSIGAGLLFEDVKNMTIRKFRMYLSMIDAKLHYTIAKQAEISGQVKFESEIKHYLKDNTRNAVEDSVVDYDNFVKKIESAN